MKKRMNQAAAPGFTLVEVIIAMAITAIVMSALISVFSAQQQVYAQQSELVQAQAAARASLSVVSRDLRMAGYTGLPLGTAHITSAMIGSGPGSYFPILASKDGNTLISSSSPYTPVINAQALAASIKTEYCPGAGSADVIEVFGNFARGSAGLRTSIVGGETISSISIETTGADFFTGTGFMRPAYVVVGNNDRAEVVVFGSGSKGTGVTSTLAITGSFTQDYKSNDIVGGEGNVVIPIFRRVYFIDAKKTLDEQGNVIPTLYVANYQADNTISGNSVELARGVDNFQVSYDVRNGTGWTTTENLPTDPCSVVGIRLRIVTHASTGKGVQVSRESTSIIRVRNAGLGTSSCPIF
jgi:type IV pilus assembly protein PilW